MRADGEPDFRFFVFDHVGLPCGTIYNDRLNALVNQVRQLPYDQVQVVPQFVVVSEKQLHDAENHLLEKGFEGVMLRNPFGNYKFGRSTVREGILLKLKRFSDAEAEIIGFAEELENQNEAEKDAFGRTKRSSCKDRKVPKGRLGAFNVRGINGPFVNVGFDCGTGLTAAQREAFWRDRDSLLGKVITYSYFAVGSRDRPRFPRFMRIRAPE